MSDDKVYTLKNPFDYAKNGDSVESQFITVVAANFKQMAHYTPIKQAFVSAINQISTDKVNDSAAQPESDGEDITGEQVMQLLHNWDGELTKVLIYAKQLFTSGVALVDGEKPMTTPMVDKMSMEDFEGLLGFYIANFIAPSLMNGQ